MVPPWATVEPSADTEAAPAQLYNLVAGKWQADVAFQKEIIDPLMGRPMLRMPDTGRFRVINTGASALGGLGGLGGLSGLSNEHTDRASEASAARAEAEARAATELQPFVEAAASCPKTGLHNPFKNKERYVLYGQVCHAAGAALSEPSVHDYFAKLIQRVMPKSYYQCWYEVKVTADFLKNWGGDHARFEAGGLHVPGDHAGQESRGYRWPYGPVAVVAPFNFPLEIPALQLVGALLMGNRPTLKCASATSVVMEQFLRMLHACGMPLSDADLMHGGGEAMGRLIQTAPFRLTQFTGSSEVAEVLAVATRGKVRLEDAGFDWKILGPDVGDDEYVAWTCDQDAYAASGQKCSAQSILFAHENWLSKSTSPVPLWERLEALANRRRLSDLTVGPVLSHDTEELLAHAARLASIPGAYVAWGGRPLTEVGTAEERRAAALVPPCYGLIQPTAVFVPLAELLKPEHFDACTTEVFGPFQVLTSYDDGSLDLVLEACERMSHHLTAALVSNDLRFQDKVLGRTVNGTTYVGRRARTTGAPQNHWFGPAGDPRGAGIGTPAAITSVWSCHREVIGDHGEVPSQWATPPAS